MLRPSQLIIISFLVLILAGTGLLMLPFATNGAPLSVIDALFMATSAACVTGLSVIDVAKELTLSGQLVILVLIQLGGLGIMTLSTFFVYLLAGRLSIGGRDIIQDTFSQHPMADLTKLLKLVFLVTFSIEICGAAVLTLGLYGQLGITKALYFGIFHSISAFCNAGFSLFANSFVDYRGDILINFVLCVLIILGGLGFVVIFDLYNLRHSFNRHSFFKLQFHSRVVLFISLVLIVSGAVLFFVLEFNNSLQGSGLRETILSSIFQSITTRTAGFNTIEISQLTNSTLFIIILFMFIGAAPGSCGGGIKSTTFIVLLSSMAGKFKMQEDVNIFFRRIPEQVVSRSIAVVFFSSMVVILFTIAILSFELPEVSHQESRGLFLEYLFEVVSAFGTVGLSTGITAKLSIPSKVLLTFLMFIGRIGPLTIALAIQVKSDKTKYKYVQENLMVG